MKCQRCEGTGWLKRLAQHPAIKAHIFLVTYTQPCPDCAGTGKTEQQPLFEAAEVTA